MQFHRHSDVESIFGVLVDIYWNMTWLWKTIKYYYSSDMKKSEHEHEDELKWYHDPDIKKT